jgi:glycosyltransferase involved in cell wall biosynthesis
VRLALVNPIARRFSGGYAKYLAEIVPRLRAHPGVSALTIWLPQDASAPAIDEGVVRRWPGALSARGVRELRTGIAAVGADVVFVPTARHIEFGGIPTLVMVRNMEPLTVPFGGNDPGEGLRNLLRRAAARRACTRASRVIAVSRHVQQFLEREWHIPKERVGIVYHGVTTGSDESASRPSLGPAGDRRPLLFTAGSLRAARGLEDVLAALPRIAAGYPSVMLVIAGRWDPGSNAYRRKISSLVDRLRLAPHIAWPDHLSAAEMTWCFRHAAAFVMTSRAEACPNTALEALANGCAIVSTSQPPMPEFLDDAAEYYAPGSPDDLAARVLALLAEGAATREARCAVAMRRSRAFDWAEAVERTIEQMQLAVGASHRGVVGASR